MTIGHLILVPIIGKTIADLPRNTYLNLVKRSNKTKPVSGWIDKT
jgi:hypothetical protein